MLHNNFGFHCSKNLFYTVLLCICPIRERKGTTFFANMQYFFAIFLKKNAVTGEIVCMVGKYLLPLQH
jgi:hypothetical protein